MKIPFRSEERKRPSIFFVFIYTTFFLQKKLCDKKIILLIGEGLSGFMQKKYIQLVKDNQVSYDLMAFEGS